MTEYTPTKVDFEASVRDHAMTILMDNGLYRHLKCAEPGTAVNHFDIVTWPGHLAISGDAGNYIFARLPDMFTFFRMSSGWINPDYWQQKLTCQDTASSLKRLNPAKLRNAVAEQFAEWDVSPESRDALWADIEHTILEASDEREAVELAQTTQFDGHDIIDLWDHDLSDYSYRFIWCCRAIVWAIDQYDKVHAAANAECPSDPKNSTVITAVTHTDDLDRTNASGLDCIPIRKSEKGEHGEQSAASSYDLRESIARVIVKSVGLDPDMICNNRGERRPIWQIAADPSTEPSIAAVIERCVHAAHHRSAALRNAANSTGDNAGS